MAQEKFVLFRNDWIIWIRAIFRAQLDEKPVHSDDSDDEAPAGGDYTVYECPGLAPVNTFIISIFIQIIFFF